MQYSYRNPALGKKRKRKHERAKDENNETSTTKSAASVSQRGINLTATVERLEENGERDAERDDIQFGEEDQNDECCDEDNGREEKIVFGLRTVHASIIPRIIIGSSGSPARQW